MTSTPRRLLDLFCGRWGWSRAFAARGWECEGFDLVEPADTPPGCTFRRFDVMHLTAADIRRGGFNFACASSPCEEFSLFGMAMFHPNPKYPKNGIRLFNHAREICWESGIPFVMENVRPAQKFVGEAKGHCGPFYLWGPGVPPLLPQGIKKGMRLGTGGFTGVSPSGVPQPGRRFAMMTAEEKKAARKTDPMLSVGSTSVARLLATAAVATIPPELSACVADYAERICVAAANQ